MSKYSDTELHRIDLLLTLDYLLNYTDEDHPATQLAICKHALKYGLKYDPKNLKDNDVKRQRIADCLQFLRKVTDKFTDDVPFVLETTPSGKYYIEQKNFLSEEQIIKILAAVQNDKYTQDEDTEFLIERLLDSLANRNNREHFKKELDKVNKGVKKYDFATNRKIRLINKAYNEQKMIKIEYKIYDFNKVDIHIYNFWYRVYKIKEFKSKPYALLIPIDTGDIRFYKNFIFDAVENLNIPTGPDKDVLMSDFKDNRDLDELFRQKSKWMNNKYESPNAMIEKNIMPVGALAAKVGFYFRKELLKFIKPSFEEFFSTNLEYVECASFDALDAKRISDSDNRVFITPHPLEEGEKSKYCVVNTSINIRAFISWLISDVHGDSLATISDMITVVGPSLVNKHLYSYYMSRAKKYADFAKPEQKKV